jgi:hypothetical protein
MPEAKMLKLKCLFVSVDPGKIINFTMVIIFFIQNFIFKLLDRDTP